MRTIFPEENDRNSENCTVFAQNSPRSPDRRVSFPVTIRHRSAKAKIYGPSKKFPYYRVAYTVAGKRQMRPFKAYPEAKAAAERIVRDLSSGSQSAALERLESLHQSTGRRVSLLAAVSEFVEVTGKLGGRSLNEAVDGYLRTIVTVKRCDIKAAVEEFLMASKPLTKAVDGQRAQLSSKYAYTREIQLRKLSDAFPLTAVCDLGKVHVDAFIGSLGEFSPKSRNHYRAAVRQFFQWAVRKDYLPHAHRLNEADAMRPEHDNTAAIQHYTPDELAALLATASDDALRACIAIGGLAGLRTAEILRLNWEDVWHVPGHIEVTARKSKNRQRRLVEICPALASWLEPHRAQQSGPVWPWREITFHQRFQRLCGQSKARGRTVERKLNGLRHAFCTYHFAAHANENLTAALAGNSPAMIHRHYKGLATKAEAEKWFHVHPPSAAKNVITLSPARGKQAQ